MSARAVWLAQPIVFGRIVAGAPTVVIGLGTVMVAPDAVSGELMGVWRRRRGDRARRDPMNELFVAVLRADGDCDPAWSGGGSGGGDGFRHSFEVGPPPAEGDLTLLVSVPSHDIVDAEVVIPGDELRQAASRAIRLWDA